ncbi:MAG TPA: alkaline phosphatase family protein [Thermoanaerobaculia bacterium]|nr:alkaline phosphatase family protein [Thermoanaerobaculia bacterium]
MPIACTIEGTRTFSIVFILTAGLAILSCRTHEEHSPVGVAHPVIFIGLDGGDWQLLDRYIASGSMPNLGALKREGSPGVLRTIHPPLSPIVWTSMMTGVDPLDHRILDFTRFNPVSGQREPITSDERHAPAIWNMCSYEHKRAAVVGMWATFPAEHIDGTVISDRLFSFQFAERKIPEGAVWPESVNGSAAEALKGAERETDGAVMRSYLPDLSEDELRSIVANQGGYDSPAGGLRRILIETAVNHRLALEAIGRDRPDLTIVYFQGTDAVGHLFAPFSPPRQPDVPEADFARYGNVPARYFAHVDELLGDYRRLATTLGATILIASDHGFHWIDDRPQVATGANAATAARWHRDEGMYLLWSPGVHSGEPAADGTAPQICSTLLALLGLPADSRLAPALPAARRFAPAREGSAAVSYERMFRKAVLARRSSVIPRTSSAADNDAMEKLKGLGYIDGREAQITAPRGSTRTPGSFSNEALILEERGRLREAEGALREALAIDADSTSANWNLSALLAREGKREDADVLLLRTLRFGYPDAPAEIVRRVLADSKEHQTGRAAGLIDKAIEAKGDEPRFFLIRGKLLMERNECRAAATDFDRAERLDSRDATAAASRALAALCLGDQPTAAKELRRSLELDPDQPQLRKYLERRN